MSHFNDQNMACTFCNESSENMVANGQWSVNEAAQSSTWRELRAVRMVLESFKVKLQNKCVRWFTDNQNVARIVQ